MSAFTGMHTTADPRVFDAVKMMSRLAQKEHSAVQSQLASRISAVKEFGARSGEGPFSSVKELITDVSNKMQFLDEVVDMPVVVQRQMSMVQKIQKTMEVPQVQVVQKTVEIPQLQIVEKIVEIPEIQRSRALRPLRVCPLHLFARWHRRQLLR